MNKLITNGYIDMFKTKPPYLIILIIVLLFFILERHLYEIAYVFKKSDIHRYHLSQFNQTDGTSILRPINNNSNWAVLILNEEKRTIYFHSRDVSNDVIDFCEHRNCIKQGNNNAYPIKLSQFQSVYCNMNHGFWKIDDDVLYNTEWLKVLEEQYYTDEKCVIIGPKSGGKVSGTLTNVYYFPTGHMYYLNNIAKEILCNNTVQVVDEPEDMAIGQILSLHCPHIIFVDIEREYGHKILNYKGNTVTIEKNPNHFKP